MRVEIENLNETGEAFAHTYAPGELSLEDEYTSLTSETIVDGHARRKGDEVRLRGTIKAEVEAACDRCLRHVGMPVEVEFDTAFIPSESVAGAAENIELQEEDLGVSFFEGDSIDVDELVREQILLALPVRLLCGEECRGLCPHCGSDLNANACRCAEQQTDPRWAALAALKEDKE